jgi:hypothetical protein
LKAQDPEFKAFVDLNDACLPNATPARNGTIPHSQCVSSMQQAVDKWCGVATFHKEKCETSSLLLGTYTAMYDIRNILRGGP